MAKKANKGLAKLRKINAEAKRIAKKHPAYKWTTCIKEAAKKV